MKFSWLIVIGLFVIATFIVHLITNKIYKKEVNEKMRKQGASLLSYWQTVIYMGAGITGVCVLFLKWTDVLSF